ncbi:lactosylceramide 1,3-N-acetyl-beta-D-glucosaminyltransferase A-like [Physella acuta]|uniref:lactosylceramide 1,3-N-acetyl-beta-D-glucosaminyltransferase A-like n=1 Tax=Physella acuta TaxID=109671 RepID=UPI0027DE240E|nr:lactosylceramide 1,3-N-acetyl-beta-D-glucosaminyltransferase A-like [Physella acuta]
MLRHVRWFVRRQCHCLSILQVLVWLMSFLMLKLTFIAFNDLFTLKTGIMRNLFPQHLWYIPSILKAPPVRYPEDSLTQVVIDTADVCGDLGRYDALMMVHTANAHFEHRQSYRDTYGNEAFTSPYRIKMVFFMGLPEDQTLSPRLVEENSLHGDTVQGNFVDTYQNLTYKAVMAFRWVSKNCKNVKLVLKMDDDVILDVHRFFEEFKLPPPYQQDTIFCHLWKNAEVERKGKWGISYDEYASDWYPAYCSGFFVVIMPTLMDDVYQAAKTTPFLWLDDVYIYGVVRQELHYIQIINLDQVAFRERYYHSCNKDYGYRCKYWATVVGDSTPFVPTMLKLRADRVRVLELNATGTVPSRVYTPPNMIGDLGLQMSEVNLSSTQAV